MKNIIGLDKKDLSSLNPYDKKELESKLEIQLCLDNYQYFREVVCGYKDFQEFHTLIDNVLLGKSKYKRIMIPRNHLKSSSIMSWIVWSLLHNPNMSVLYESSIYRQAKKYVSEIKNIITCDKFKFRFGDWVGTPWTDSDITVSKRKISQPAPTISASGLDKTQTGQHYDLIILDDLVDENNSKTEEGRQKAIDRYNNAISLLRPSGTIVIVGTPWDRDDLYGWIDKNPAASQLFETLKLDVYDRNGRIRFREKFCETIEEELLNPGKRSLESLRIQNGPYKFSCNPAEAPILMADLSEKRIEHIKPGDEVIGFEFGNRKSNVKKTRLVKTKVIATGSRLALVYKITLASGKIIRCTQDHKWFTGRLDKDHQKYLPAKIGRNLIKLFGKYEFKEHPDWKWLAGIIDGEGSVHNRNPAKKDRIVENILQNSSGYIFSEQDKVIKIEPDQFETVYSFQTETGNYICWGYASKNCQYRINPDAEAFGEFRPTWIKRISNDLAKQTLQSPARGVVRIFCDPAMGKENSVAPCDTAIILTHFRKDKVIDVLGEDVQVIDPGSTIISLHDYALIHSRTGEVEVYIEDVGFQGVMITQLEKLRNESGVYYGIFASRPTQDKDRRIRGLFPYYRFGQINHVEALVGGKLETELERFPKIRLKDAADALSQFVYMCNFPLQKKEETLNIYAKNAVTTMRAPVVKKNNDGLGESSYMFTNDKDSLLNYNNSEVF